MPQWVGHQPPVPSGPPPGTPGGPPPWGPPQQWTGPPGPPPRRGRGKWILAGLATIAVIALTVAITVLVTRPDSGGDSPTPQNGSVSEFASADDRGPVGIITEDPTCAAWGRVANEYVSQEKNARWGERDPLVPATAWTPEQRAMYEAVGTAMRSLSDQVIGLAKTTPNRVMRELYSQFAAYARVFSAAISTYTVSDNANAAVADSIASTLVNVCSAITVGSAATQAPFVPKAPAPSKAAAPGDPASPQRFLADTTSVCSEWTSNFEKFDSDTAQWRAIDAGISAAQWTPEQKALNEAVAPVMVAAADDMIRLGQQSGNPTFEDFAVLSAQYRHAYVQALPTYTSADNYLVNVATNLANAVYQACKAAA